MANRSVGARRIREVIAACADLPRPADAPARASLWVSADGFVVAAGRSPREAHRAAVLRLLVDRQLAGDGLDDLPTEIGAGSIVSVTGPLEAIAVLLVGHDTRVLAELVDAAGPTDGKPRRRPRAPA